MFLWVWIHTHCFISPQPEQRSKWKWRMQATVCMSVNITLLSLVNTQSASPGEASPFHAGRLLLMPLAVHSPCTFTFREGNIARSCVLQPLWGGGGRGGRFSEGEGLGSWSEDRYGRKICWLCGRGHWHWSRNSGWDMCKSLYIFLYTVYTYLY